MKIFKNYLFLLALGASVFFSACEPVEDLVEVDPFDPPTLADLYVVSTYNPDVKSDEVILKGNLQNGHATLAYGFMWYVKPSDQGEAQVHTVKVGEGDMHGDFEKAMTSLPKGVNLVVCAYVDYKATNLEIVNSIGEEIDFIYD
jgi:hypothetical protein